MHLPKEASWIMTNKCNMHCKHCYPNSGKAQKNELGLEDIVKITDNLKACGVEQIYLSGGEALLRPDIFEILHYMKSKQLNLWLCSNGSTITSEYLAKKLKSSGITHVSIGLDSPVEEVHDKFRGYKGAYKGALEAVRYCKGVGLVVTLDITVTRQNADTVLGLAKLASDHNVDAAIIRRFVPLGRGKRNRADLYLPTCEYYALVENWKKLEQTYPKLIFSAHEPLYVSFSCKAAKSWCGILPNGDLTPCPLMPIKLGNLKENRLEDLWLKNNVVRDLQNSRINGCRTYAYITTSNYLGKDPYMP